MQKDLKTGMFLGLILAITATLWLSTRPSISMKARILHSNDTDSLDEPTEQPRFITDLPNTTSADVQIENIKADIETKGNNTPDAIAYEQTKNLQSNKIGSTRFHIVREGETLSDISYKYYGSSNRWPKILNANRNAIKDANKLRPGTKLIIPE